MPISKEFLHEFSSEYESYLPLTSAAHISYKIPSSRRCSWLRLPACTCLTLPGEGRIVAWLPGKVSSRQNAERLRSRSGSTIPADTPELGYVVVEPDHLGQHLSTKVPCRILLEFEGETVFATLAITQSNTF